MRLVILGGTTEATRLAARLADRADISATLSYAGRTEVPASQPIPVRVGGFGGAEGLARYLAENKVDLLIDATHPFAARISANAADAARATETSILVLTRKPWTRQASDTWIEVANNAEAVAALGDAPRRVFLTIGRLGVGDFRAAPQHHYLIRTIDAPDRADMPPDHRLILARGTFALDDEIALMRAEKIDVLVTKNSGGDATYAKIAAARALSIPVVMVTPPRRPDVPEVYSTDDCMRVIEGHLSASG
jgi:precorrin-6A/cobalt-precorrin-6A reductase